MQDKDTKLNVSRAFINTLRSSEFLMYNGSLFHSLQAVNEKDLCVQLVLR